MTLRNSARNKAQQLFRPIENRLVYAKRRARLARLEGGNALSRGFARLMGRPVPPKRNFRGYRTREIPLLGYRNGKWVVVGYEYENVNKNITRDPMYKKYMRNYKRSQFRSKLPF